MAKRIDITDKLNFEEKPVVIVKDKEIEINDSAENVIRIMGMIDEADPSPSVLGKMADMIFTGKGKENLKTLNLNMEDYSKVIEAAMDLITGEDEGELPSDTMTS